MRSPRPSQAHKRRQRHTRRVARNVGVAVVLLFVLAGSLAWLTAGNARQPAVAPSTARGDVAARVGADWRVGRVVALEPDVGYVRGPLIASGEYVALATGVGLSLPALLNVTESDPFLFLRIFASAPQRVPFSFTRPVMSAGGTPGGASPSAIQP